MRTQIVENKYELVSKKELSKLLLTTSTGVIRIYLWVLQSSNVLLRLVQ